MLNAFASKCSKKCVHNVQKPNERAWAQGSGKSAILPFCFHRWSHCDARLYSIDYLHWGDFAELKEITVSINRFVFLPF